MNIAFFETYSCERIREEDLNKDLKVRLFSFHKDFTKIMGCQIKSLPKLKLMRKNT